MSIGKIHRFSVEGTNAALTPGLTYKNMSSLHKSINCCPELFHLSPQKSVLFWSLVVCNLVFGDLHLELWIRFVVMFVFLYIFSSRSS